MTLHRAKQSSVCPHDRCRHAEGATSPLTRSIDPSDFAAVDQARSPEDLVRYLREAALLAEMKATNDYLAHVLDAKRGHRVLDVGCGNGDEVRRLASAVGPSGLVVGLDRPAMIEAARSSGTPKNAEFVEGDAHNLPFEESSFDRYRTHRVYMHLKDPAKALAEAGRVVRPGGVVVVAEPDWGTIALDSDDREVTSAVLEAIRDSMQEPWIGRRLPRLFREAGLVDVQIAPQYSLLPNYQMALDALLTNASNQVVESRGFSADRVQSWLQELERHNSDGNFFFGALLIVVRGFRPKQRRLDSLIRAGRSLKPSSPNS